MTRRAKRRLPDGLDAIADEAQERLLARQAPPRVRIEKDEKGWRFSCPYSKEDEERWWALIADAFGTRCGGLIDHFLERITELVPEGRWNREKKFWYPSEPDFNAVLAIVASLKPENEAQAAHAAQLAALHLSAMKLGEHATRYGNERTVAILAKTTRAYGEGIERMARLQGRVQPKTVNQTIQVIYVDGRSVNQFAGGYDRIGDQPHATGDAGTAPELSALPSSRAHNGQTVSPTSRSREARMQTAWWLTRFWRAFRRA
jgi:hypothetical protein